MAYQSVNHEVQIDEDNPFYFKIEDSRSGAYIVVAGSNQEEVEKYETQVTRYYNKIQKAVDNRIWDALVIIIRNYSAEGNMYAFMFVKADVRQANRLNQPSAVYQMRFQSKKVFCSMCFMDYGTRGGIVEAEFDPVPVEAEFDAEPTMETNSVTIYLYGRAKGHSRQLASQLLELMCGEIRRKFDESHAHFNNVRIWGEELGKQGFLKDCITVQQKNDTETNVLFIGTKITLRVFEDSFELRAYKGCLDAVAVDKKTFWEYVNNNTYMLGKFNKNPKPEPKDGFELDENDKKEEARAFRDLISERAGQLIGAEREGCGVRWDKRKEAFMKVYDGLFHGRLSLNTDRIQRKLVRDRCLETVNKTVCDNSMYGNHCEYSSELIYNICGYFCDAMRTDRRYDFDFTNKGNKGFKSFSIYLPNNLKETQSIYAEQVRLMIVQAMNGIMVEVIPYITNAIKRDTKMPPCILVTMLAPLTESTSQLCTGFTRLDLCNARFTVNLSYDSCQGHKSLTFSVLNNYENDPSKKSNNNKIKRLTFHGEGNWVSERLIDHILRAVTVAMITNKRADNLLLHLYCMFPFTTIIKPEVGFTRTLVWYKQLGAREAAIEKFMETRFFGMLATGASAAECVVCKGRHVTRPDVTGSIKLMDTNGNRTLMHCPRYQVHDLDNYFSVEASSGTLLETSF